MTCPKPCSRYRLPTSKLCTKLPLETRKQRTACLSHLPAIYATVRDKEHSHLWLLAIWSPLILSRGTPCLVNAISSEWLDPKRLHILCLGKADSTCCKLKHVSSVLYIKSQRGGVFFLPPAVWKQPRRDLLGRFRMYSAHTGEKGQGTRTWPSSGPKGPLLLLEFFY